MRLFFSGLGLLLDEESKSDLYKLIQHLEHELENFETFDFTTGDIKELISDLQDTSQLKSGKQTLIVLKIEQKNHTYVIKLYPLPFQDILLHTLSINEVKSRITQNNEETGIESFLPLEIFGLGIIELSFGTLSFLIQDYCDYDDFKDLLGNIHNLKSMLKETSKNMANNGFVIDPSPTNYKIQVNSNNNLFQFYYLDLCFFNDFQIRDYSKELTKNLFDNSYDGNELVEYTRSTS